MKTIKKTGLVLSVLLMSATAFLFNQTIDNETRGALPSFSVTRLDSPNGVVVGGSPSGEEYFYGDNINLKAIPNDGYYFSSYVNDLNKDCLSTHASSSIRIIKNLTIYPEFKPLEENFHSIVFIYDNARIINYEFNNVYNSNEGLLLPTVDEFYYYGYIFEGWYDNELFNGEKITEISPGSTKEYVLYAHFVPLTKELVSHAKDKYENQANATLKSSSFLNPFLSFVVRHGNYDNISGDFWKKLKHGEEILDYCFTLTDKKEGSLISFSSPSILTVELPSRDIRTDRVFALVYESNVIVRKEVSISEDKYLTIGLNELSLVVIVGEPPLPEKRHTPWWAYGMILVGAGLIGITVLGLIVIRIRKGKKHAV